MNRRVSISTHTAPLAKITGSTNRSPISISRNATAYYSSLSASQDRVLTLVEERLG